MTFKIHLNQSVELYSTLYDTIMILPLYLHVFRTVSWPGLYVALS